MKTKNKISLKGGRIVAKHMFKLQCLSFSFIYLPQKKNKFISHLQKHDNVPVGKISHWHSFVRLGLTMQ